MQLTVLDPDDPSQDFPPVSHALTEPDGLLAVGGCLSTQRLLNAYRHGIFPWNNPDEPILWWSPDPRLVLFPEKLVISRSLAKIIRKQAFSFTIDHAFGEVMHACAQPRKGSSGTWITEGIFAAYLQLNQLGYAHSAETWLKGKLVGGIYGITIGRVFFGESMFHTETDASKFAFVSLIDKLKAWGYQLIDCQVSTEHLKRFGAEEITRDEFQKLLERHCEKTVDCGAWSLS